MKTLTTVLTFACMTGFTTFAFAGNHPAVPPTSPAAKFAATAGPVKANAWHDAVLSTTGAVVVPRAGNGICPVMGERITSKRNAVVTLSNGRHMEVCCAPCGREAEKDLAKYRAFMY